MKKFNTTEKNKHNLLFAFDRHTNLFGRILQTQQYTCKSNRSKMKRNNQLYVRQWHIHNFEVRAERGGRARGGV